jgi:hypothetical protein
MQSLRTSCCPPEQENAVAMALREALATAIVHGHHEDLHMQREPVRLNDMVGDIVFTQLHAKLLGLTEM